MKRILLLSTGLAAGLAVGVVSPEVTGAIRTFVAPQAAQGQAAPAGAGHGGEEHQEEGGLIELSSDQIEAAAIRTAAVGPGAIDRLVTVPATLGADQDRLVRVPARVTGTVAELRRRLGDQVAAGDVLAVIESREMAEAKADLLAAARQEALTRTTLERERRLWERRVSAEQDYLKARAEADEARVRLDLARQRLVALGLGEAEVSALLAAGNGAAAFLRRHEVRAPIAGRVIARRAETGAAVGAEAELFTIADLSQVWVELPVRPDDLIYVREGQEVTVTPPTGGDVSGRGRIAFVSPVVDQETGAARVVATLPNAEGHWRPGTFAVAVIAASGGEAEIVVPREAIQTIKGENVVFVRTERGFERREVVLGRGNERVSEVVFGLDPGDVVATANSFVLKAQLARGEAAHSHAH
ncbi:efflux RND transporter periplasmic adaptor subunit [Falsiroseomonas sp. CW058]|uniref:efflux RND transporter periplasmic adaptor subunit n=1 Tax=Falsiroseomonas sp. CW058 TaxID=3388664 RepID=UPI003D31D176